MTRYQMEAAGNRFISSSFEKIWLVTQSRTLWGMKRSEAEAPKEHTPVDARRASKKKYTKYSNTRWTMKKMKNVVWKSAQNDKIKKMENVVWNQDRMKYVAWWEKQCRPNHTTDKKHVHQNQERARNQRSKCKVWALTRNKAWTSGEVQNTSKQALS